MSNRRWRRHYLLMHSPSGIYPLPVEFWLTFPERGVLTCYEFGMLRSLLLEKVAPKQFHDKEMEGLRTFYPGDMGEDMLERMVFKPWLELSMVETSRVVHQLVSSNSDSSNLNESLSSPAGGGGPNRSASAPSLCSCNYQKY